MGSHFSVISALITIAMINKRHMMSSAYELTGNKVIIGSGMTGLWLARQITDAGQGKDLTVYEKSNVFGGRCATRQSRATPDVKYDTGAQYYSLKDMMKAPHDRWQAAGMTKQWFKDGKGVPRINSKVGMASLAKQLTGGAEGTGGIGGDVSVLQGWKVMRVEQMQGEKGTNEVRCIICY